MNLKDYIQGKRKGKEANRLEREAMNNPFLQDAIDGFDAVDGNHLSTIEMLEKQIEGKTERKKNRIVLFRWQMLAVAASVIILFGVSSLLFLQPLTMETHYETAQELSLPTEKQIENMELALANKEDETKQEEMIPPPPIAYNIQEISIVANEDAMEMLDEIQVVDVDMSVARRDLTGAIASVSAENMKQGVVTSSEQLLQGKVAGLSVTQAPQASKETRLRGNLSVSEEKKVSGIVLDERGEPLIGASIVVEGTTIGTITDIDGKYELTIPPNGKIIASYVGCQSKEIKNQQFNKTILTPESLALNEEVVAVGYGTARRSNLTGAVASVSAKSAKEKSSKFDKESFLKYFEENRRQDICQGIELKFRAEFYIDEKGVPFDVEIESNCEAFQDEFIYWLNKSPKWTVKPNELIVIERK